MQEIQGTAKTVRGLLSGTKYSIDYYQREYKWTQKEVVELIRDLTGMFLEDYDEEHERKAVKGYGQYFLGSIIISDKNGRKYIVDGQQRLTTLTLLLIFLNNLQMERDDQVNVEGLIFSEQFGEKSYNIDVEERVQAMNALFNRESLDDNGLSESAANVLARYEDIEQNFPDELREGALPFFMDWLIENVNLVEITAFSDEDAYTIFETMNDRGLSLTPRDMLKGYLLANIDDQDMRWRLHGIWRERMSSLAEIGDSDEASDFLKAWLRSQYAETIRERKRGARPGDFDRIGTEFHRWVRDKRDWLGISRPGDFQRLIERDIAYYARQFELVRGASQEMKPGLEDLYFIAQHGFTLQYPLLLAPLLPDDDHAAVHIKLRAVAIFVDILLARRVWNWRSISYSTMQYAMFLVMKDVRAKSAEEVGDILYNRLQEDEETFRTNPRFWLHGQNRVHVHRILARLTDFVERSSGMPSRYKEYVIGSGRNKYEVEHIWSNHAEWHRDEFAHPADFAEYRNRIGGLLLLPKSFNASYGDRPYEEKLPHYYGQNLLAQSLHPNCYQHNPGFLAFVEKTGLPFTPHDQFLKADMEARQQLYLELAELLWRPEKLLELRAPDIVEEPRTP